MKKVTTSELFRSTLQFYANKALLVQTFKHLFNF